MTEFLTANEILNYEDIKTVVVEVPHWGGKKVTLREMSGADLDAYENSLFKSVKVEGGRIKVERDRENGRAKLVSKCLVDPATGLLMFKSDEKLQALGIKNGKALSFLHEECVKLNGLEPAEEQKTEAKSEADPSQASSTDTQENSD